MNALSFFYSARMAVVFILMLSSATLEAQRNENEKFFDLMATIGDYFGGEFNDSENTLTLDLNATNSFLKELHTFATLEIVRKKENGEFECKKSKKPAFIKAIKEILGEKSDKEVRNLLSAIIVPKSSAKIPSKIDDSLKLSSKEVNIIKTVMGEQSFKKVKHLVNELSVKFSDEQLFNLLFSLAARLEALVHGKNIDGTPKEKKENPKDKIQTFLAVPKCFILPEWELSIFDYWIEIIEMKTKNSQKPIFGVAIYNQKYEEFNKEYFKEKSFRFSQENYQILKQLNDQKLSIYKSTNLLRAAFNWAYAGEQKHILRGKIPHILNSVFYLNWDNFDIYEKTHKCEYAMFFQNISESLMKMISDKGIDPKLHLESIDFKIQEYVQNDVEENCKKFGNDNEEAKIMFLNKVHYELAINFEYNQRKEVYDRVEDLLSDWIGHRGMRSLGILQLSKVSYLKRNAFYMLGGIEHFTMNTNRETISIIEALIEKEHFNQLNLATLFDKIKKLVEKEIPEEEANFEKAKKEINTKQLENEIEFLKNNPKSIAEEKYEKAVQIICTIKQHGEKVKMLKSKIKTFEIKEQLNELSSKIQNNEKKYIGPELWKQTKKYCKIEQIEMEEIVSEEELLEDIQFEFNKIWNSSKGVWEGIEKYYLSIPLMQLKKQERTLALTFEKLLQNVKELYAQKMYASNVSGE